MGQLRAPHFVSNMKMKLTCIVDSYRPGGEALAAQYELPFFESIEAAAAEVKCDAVWISTPTPCHNEAIKAAATAGWNIFVEKPVAAGPDEISELFEFCEKAGVQLCCGFQRRFDTTYVAAKDAIAEGKIGRPLMCSIFFGDHPVPPIEFLKQGGDPFMDLSPHDLDFVRFVLQDEVSEVSGYGMSSTKDLAHAGVLDNAVVHLRFRQGLMCTLMMSRGATYGYDQRAEFFGTLGRVQIDNQQRNSCVLADGSGVQTSPYKYSFPQRFFEAFAAEADAFADACLGTAKWPITEKDCCVVQAIATLASQSSAQGGKSLKFEMPSKFGMPSSAEDV